VRGAGRSVLDGGVIPNLTDPECLFTV